MEKLSIIVTVYNEEDNIKSMIANISKAMLPAKTEYEVIFVDDGSIDNTANVIRDNIAKNVTLIELKRNFGQTAALKAGIDHASGEYIATLDGDLQNDPDDLLMMLDVLKRNNWDVVTGVRANRFDSYFLKKIPSYIANLMVRKICHTNIRDNGCGIKVFRSDILKEIPLFGERHRFIASLAELDGAKVEQVDVKHHPRVHGKSKYGFGRTLKVISDLILMNFSRKYGQSLMYLFGPIGVITWLAGVIILTWMLILKILGQSIWGRPILILGILLLFIGFQIISTGLILDRMTRNEFETNLKKPYKTRRVSHAE